MNQQQVRSWRRNRFYDLLSDVGKDVIVILSTHIVDDVRELCTEMAIMDFGKIVFQGKPQDGINELNGKVLKNTLKKPIRYYKNLMLFQID